MKTISFFCQATLCIDIEAGRKAMGFIAKICFLVQVLLRTIS
jgi:hypothetical protein